VAEVKAVRDTLTLHKTHQGELAAFTAYAITFPDKFLALIDTYDTLNSGLPNAVAVSVALHRFGFKPLGIRLDSGDLSSISISVRAFLRKVADEQLIPSLATLSIVASDDITEDRILKMNESGHEIDVFGVGEPFMLINIFINFLPFGDLFFCFFVFCSKFHFLFSNFSTGTHLVTNKKQPALGGVYKLVENNGAPCIKLSQDMGKVTLPAQKQPYRIHDANGIAIMDYLALVSFARFFGQ
jgi:nicotinate phosphoribosyltransferase